MSRRRGHSSRWLSLPLRPLTPPPSAVAVTRSDSGPSIKGKEEVGRRGLAYQPKHRGAQTAIWFAGNHTGLNNVCFCVCGGVG